MKENNMGTFDTFLKQLKDKFGSGYIAKDV